MIDYKDRMLRFMPGRRAVDKERAFIVIFSTMVGAVEIARMMPDPAARQRLANPVLNEQASEGVP
jgi:TetR/AcrR family transcriptional repressor of nem operon